MALYLDHCIKTAGLENEHAAVRKRYALINELFGGLWTVEQAIVEAKADVFKDKAERIFSLRILTSQDQP